MWNSSSRRGFLRSVGLATTALGIAKVGQADEQSKYVQGGATATDKETESERSLSHRGSTVARRQCAEVWPVPPTPFTKDNQIDEAAVEALVEFYITAGVEGLFIAAYSGEVFELTHAERLALSRQVVRLAAGRLRVVASGNVADDLESQVHQLQELADTGLDTVVVLLSTLPRPDHLREDSRVIADRVSGPLGVYECPLPEHRLLSAQDVAALAATGRFVFLKETSRDRAIYQAKLAAAHGTPLQSLQANFGQLPMSLADGGPGFCGIVANVFPELVNAYCNDRTLSEDARGRLHAVLNEALGCITRRHYPASLKYVLQRRGLPMNDHSRMASGVAVDDEDRRFLDESLERLQMLQPPRALLDKVVRNVATR